MTPVVFRTAALPSGAWRRVWLILAVLALAMKLLVPPGFMASSSNALPFALVLCTGQGAVLADHGDLGEAPGGKSAHDAPCAFAGHAAGAPAPNLLDATPAGFAAYRLSPAIDLADLAPGRGLAAPPLPARGPPSLI